MSGLSSVAYFLLSTLFSVLIFVLWARFALRFFRISFLHPTNQAIHAFTNPLVNRIERGLKLTTTRANRYDWACLIALLLTEILKFTLLSFLFLGEPPSFLFLFLYSLADLIREPCNLMFYAILIRVIISWVNPRWQHPIAELIYFITEPLLSMARRLIKPMGGLDFSPFVVMLSLKVVTLFIGSSLVSPFL